MGEYRGARWAGTTYRHNRHCLGPRAQGGPRASGGKEKKREKERRRKGKKGEGKEEEKGEEKREEKGEEKKKRKRKRKRKRRKEKKKKEKETKERNEILFLKRNLRSLLLFFPLDHLLVQYSNSFCFHTKLEQDQKLLICTPFACAMVFSDAFALILFMLMNKLQHYSFIESLRFQGA